jgi:hypothetical protein
MGGKDNSIPRRGKTQQHFDDKFFYEEIARPVNERKLFTKQLLRDEAMGAFEK